jgi:aerobic carbon-monoxide dehydrogenase medium subunit
MIPQAVTYTRANSVAEAIGLLGANPDAKILSGGHSLVPALKLRLNSPSEVIDIARIAELRFIKDRGNFIAIGAASTHHDVARHDHIKSRYAAMVQAGSGIGGPQVRNRGTLGGSVAHADPSADWPAVLLALGASIKVEGASGSRVIAAADFFTGFFSTALAEGEIITEIQVPEPAAGARSTYQKFVQPASRFAIVGCAAAVTVEGGIVTSAKIAFTGVSSAAFLDEAVAAAIIGKAATTANIEAAANAACEGLDYINEDHFASQTYRKHIAKVYAKRALMAVCG